MPEDTSPLDSPNRGEPHGGGPREAERVSGPHGRPNAGPTKDKRGCLMVPPWLLHRLLGLRPGGA